MQRHRNERGESRERLHPVGIANNRKERTKPRQERETLAERKSFHRKSSENRESAMSEKVAAVLGAMRLGSAPFAPASLVVKSHWST